MRSKNARAGAFSHLATSGFFELNQKVFIEILEKPSKKVQMIAQVNHEPSWMDLLIDYLEKGPLPNNPTDARKIKRQAPWYVILDGRLYKRSFSFLLL